MQVLAAGLLLLLAVAPARAQGSAAAALRGAITDSTGRPLGDVRLVLRHEPTGRSAATLTDANGLYVLTNIAPGGPYSVLATALGWAPGTRLMHFDAGAVHRLDLVLVPEAVALPTIAVTAPAGARFGQSRDGAATLLDRQAVTSKATLERNVAELAALSPMACPAAAPRPGHCRCTRWSSSRCSWRRSMYASPVSVAGCSTW